MPREILINGKFYSAQMTGVHRVAEELLRALDELASAGEITLPRPAKIMLPANAARIPRFQNFETAAPGKLPWVWWEQVELPWRARGDVLLNLCNLGPLAHRGGITMIHDAQIYITPESYSRAFVAWYRVALPTLGWRSRKILTVSDYSRRMLIAHGVARPDRIDVIPNGVDHILRSTPDMSAFKKLGLADKGYVLALAATHAHKNIGLLFDAFRQMPDLKLVLIGAADKAAFAAKGQEAPDNVVFAGRVTDDEMRGLMERALCFACPSLTEGFGLPPLEAMLVGCPAIAAPCGALPEVCGDAALYADAHDPAAWIAAINSLRADTELRAEKAAAGIAQASRFTWRNSARLLAEAISSSFGLELAKKGAGTETPYKEGVHGARRATYPCTSK